MAKNIQDILSDMETLSASLRGQAQAVDAAIASLRAGLGFSDHVVEPAQPASLAPPPRPGLHAGPVDKGKELGETAISLLRFIGENGDSHIGKIQSFSKGIGLTNYDGLRSRLSDYAKKKWLIRVNKGVYRLTQSGAAKCGFDAGKSHRGEDAGASSTSIRQHVSVPAEHAGPSGKPPAQPRVMSVAERVALFE